MSVKLVKALGTITIKDKTMVVSSADITVKVGSTPMASVSLHEDIPMKTKVQTAASGDITDKLAGHQSVMFTGRTDPDVTLTLSTSAGEDTKSVEINGFLTAPQFVAGVGDFNYNYGIAHVSSLMSAFTPGVYKPDIKYLDGDTKSDTPNEAFASLVLRDSNPTSLKEFLQGTLDKIISLSNPKNSDTEPELTQIYRRNLESLNTLTIEYWKSVLQNTDAGIWADMGSLRNPQKLGVIDVINSLYRSGGFSGFDSILAGISAEFQVLYVPSLTAPFGKLVGFDALYTPDGSLDLDVSRSTIQTGSQQALPTTAVAIRPASRPAWRQNDGGGTPGQKELPQDFIVSFPEDTIPIGRVRELPAPNWILIPDESSVKLTRNGAIRLDTYRDNMKKITEYHSTLLDAKGPVSRILKQYAKNAYASLALGYSRSTITIPMDLTMEVGKAYKVNLKSEMGNPGSFTGFLESVTHSMRTAENQGTASSTLIFSHTQAGDFTLPGL